MQSPVDHRAEPLHQLNPAPTSPLPHPITPPLIPQPQEPFLPPAHLTRLQRLVNLFPPGQFLRYLCVGVSNTLFGYSTFVLALTLLTHALPPRFLPFTVILASILSTPINITVAYFGYKLFVFRTRGNHLVEWLRCFAVYGTGMIPGLLALSALTRLFQTTLDHHHATLAATLHQIEALLHLSSTLHPLIARVASSKTAAGNLAGAIVIAVSTLYNFVGHKKFSFKR